MTALLHIERATAELCSTLLSSSVVLEAGHLAVAQAESGLQVDHAQPMSVHGQGYRWSSSVSVVGGPISFASANTLRSPLRRRECGFDPKADHP